MNQHSPDINQIEKILHSIQALPGDRFYQRMALAPWKDNSNELEGGPKMNLKFKYIWVITLILLTLLITLALSPVGSVLADEVLQFFKRAQGNTLPLPPEQVIQALPSTTTPEPTYALTLLPAAQITHIAATDTITPNPEIDTKDLQNLNINTASNYAGFDIYQPLEMPRDYRLTSINYLPEQQAVSLRYASPRASSGEFFMITEGKNIPPLSVGIDAKVETVLIDSIEAEFVRGQWFVPNGSTESVWENNAEIYTLRWQINEITISLEFFLNDTFYPAYLKQDEMLAIARSLKRCSKVDTAHECGVRQASAAVDFTPWQLPAAPDGFTFQSVDYQADQTAIWYANDTGKIGIFQSYQDFSTHKGETTWPSAPPQAIQNVTMKGLAAEYVRGEFILPVGSNEAVWNADSPLERLRWKNGEDWFQIIKWGKPILGRGLLSRLAEELNASSNQVWSGPQHLPTDEQDITNASSRISDIETIAKFDILEPGMLPDELPFSHARFEPVSRSVMLFYGRYAADKIHADGPTLLIIENPLSQQGQDLDSSYPPEAIETVQVNGYSGQIIKGTLFTNMPESGKPTPTPIWKPESQNLTLQWKTKDRFYSIHFNTTGNSGARLSVEDLIKIAESLH
jgi:hypothetical protein